MHAVTHGIRDRLASAENGPKGPPSAPPAIPPIIINPFNRQMPTPAIDPRPAPVGPPVCPPPGPGWRCAAEAAQAA